MRAELRRLAVGGLAVAFVGVVFGLHAAPALAAYTARVQAGTLTVTGNGASDKLALHLDGLSPNTLQLDVGEDGTTDLGFDRTTFNAIVVNAGGGNDEVRVDRSGGTFTDELVTINGGDGNDTLLGGDGADALNGGGGDDFVDGNIGSDRVTLGTGNDRFQWDPGDGSDFVDGQGGVDELDFNGSNASENITLSPDGAGVRLARDIAGVTMDLDGIEDANLRMLGGVDAVRVADLTGTALKTADVDLAGFDGSGDGAADTVTAVATDAPDRIDLSNSGEQLAVRGLAAQTRVSGGEEALDNLVVQALGGADTITMSIGVTGPTPANVDGGEGADTVRYVGTPNADQVTVVPNGGEVATVAPGTTRLDTTAVESLDVVGLGGDDTLVGLNGIGTLTSLTLDGGGGEDTLRGGDGADLLIGGAGDDLVDGNIGADRALLGTGADRFQWDPGDGSDVVEGQGGVDQLDFNGSNIGENLSLTPNGRRVRLSRDIGGVTMDFDGIEQANLRMLGGADAVTVDSLAGTVLKTVAVDLSAFGGGGDGSADTVTANGTSGRDVVQVTRSGAEVSAVGLPALIRVVGSEPALDTLRLQTLAGDDDVTVAPDVQDAIGVQVDLATDE
ncbi:MAG TPA: calcium-binding protein [Gaiellaceae bacterium]|nr:calcium-binding protein [Gaiellaceae bacterium]